MHRLLLFAALALTACQRPAGPADSGVPGSPDSGPGFICPHLDAPDAGLKDGGPPECWCNHPCSGGLVCLDSSLHGPLPASLGGGEGVLHVGSFVCRASCDGDAGCPAARPYCTEVFIGIECCATVVRRQYVCCANSDGLGSGSNCD